MLSLNIFVFVLFSRVVIGRGLVTLFTYAFLASFFEIQLALKNWGQFMAPECSIDSFAHLLYPSLKTSPQSTVCNWQKHIKVSPWNFLYLKALSHRNGWMGRLCLEIFCLRVLRLQIQMCRLRFILPNQKKIFLEGYRRNQGMKEKKRTWALESSRIKEVLGI